MIEDNLHLVHLFKRFKNIRELLSSDEYSQHRPFLTRLFNEPRVIEYPGCRPRIKSFLRIVQWNIEYGKRLADIVEALNEHPVLGFADLLLLNEVDDGVPRSGNVSIATELSRQLNAHAIVGVEYLELSSAAGEGHRSSAGEPDGAITRSAARLHGCAIISRLPFCNPRIVRLPRCEDNFGSNQKRLGGRAGVIANVHLATGEVTVATAHLDVVNTPRCRQVQTRALLEAVEQERAKPCEHSQAASDKYSATRAALVGGDLNTHTFARGGHIRAVINLGRILAANRYLIAKDLLNPLRKEPLLKEFARFGYELESFNDRSPTNSVGVEELSASSALPPVVRQLAVNRLRAATGFSIPFRLDWIAASGLTPLSDGEIHDPATGVSSIGPTTVSGMRSGGKRLSDHDPIVVDVRM